jgi:hypothetical protein
MRHIVMMRMGYATSMNSHSLRQVSPVFDSNNSVVAYSTMFYYEPQSKYVDRPTQYADAVDGDTNPGLVSTRSQYLRR